MFSKWRLLAGLMLLSVLIGGLAGCPQPNQNVALTTNPDELAFGTSRNTLTLVVSKNNSDAFLEPVVAQANNDWITVESCTSTSDGCTLETVLDRVRIPITIDRSKTLLGSNMGSVTLSVSGASVLVVPVSAVTQVRANFRTSTASPLVNTRVSFTDLSEAEESVGDIESWSWSFGDGSGSNDRNPSHIYETPGDYTVSLTVRAGEVEETAQRLLRVESGDAGLTVNFEASRTVIDAGDTVTFTDLSSTDSGPIVERMWDFGDGTPEVTTESQTVQHRYDSAGVFSVSLTAITDFTQKSAMRTNYIVVRDNVPPTASFVVGTTDVFPIDPVQFTDRSDPGSSTVTSWAWWFDYDEANPGSPDSTEQNPSHEYPALGEYAVRLEITNDAGTDVLQRTITVGYKKPVVDFEAAPRSIEPGEEVAFTDLSTPGAGDEVESWLWEFGDGNSSLEQNPTHVFTTEGTYDVRLTVTSTVTNEADQQVTLTNTLLKRDFIVVGAEDDGGDPFERECPDNLIRDGSFEGGTPNGVWNEFSSFFTSPLFDVNETSNTGGGTGPRTGDWWLVFGASGRQESGFVTQNVVIPNTGQATLSFYLEIPVAEGNGTLTISLDGTPIFAATALESLAFVRYQQVEIDVSPWADGQLHELRILGQVDGGELLYFFLDDFCLQPEGSGAEGEGSEGPSVFVDVDSTADNPNGLTWAQAFPTIQEGMDAAIKLEYPEVWVADGDYDASAPLEIPDGISIYGGFAGVEETRDERIVGENETIVRLGFQVAGASLTTVVDGFTFDSSDDGVGDTDLVDITNTAASGRVVVSNCTFRDMDSPSAVRVFQGESGSRVEITGCVFEDMSEESDSIRTADGAEFLIITDCIFRNSRDNAVALGTGRPAMNDTLIRRCTFDNIDADDPGAAIWALDAGSVTIVNSVFDSNTSQGNGGAISTSLDTSITNCTFVNNEAEGGVGGAIYNDGGALSIVNTAIWQNFPGSIGGDAASVADSLVEGGYDGGTNILDEDPRFGSIFRSNFIPRPESPLVDMADNLQAPPLDRRGATRPVGLVADIGAYELRDDDEFGPVDEGEPEGEYEGEDVIEGDTIGAGPGSEFRTITEAVANASNGDTLLVEPITVYDLAYGEEFPITPVDGVTLIAAGEPSREDWPTVSGTSVGPTFFITGENPVVFERFIFQNAKPIFIVEEGELILRNCELLRFADVAIQGNNGTVRLENCRITNDQGCANGQAPLYMINSVLDLKETFLRGNCGVEGGAIYANGGSIFIEDSLFEGNLATKQINNSQPGLGGAIYAINLDGDMDIRNTQFLGNSAEDAGGTFYVQNVLGRFIMEDVLIAQSRCGLATSARGGAIHVTGSRLDFTRVEIYKSEASLETGGKPDGAAIYAENTSAIITDCDFTANTMSADAGDFTVGGAIALRESPEDWVITRTRFVDNYSRWCGGAIWFEDANNALVLDGCVFSGNVAEEPSGVQPTFWRNQIVQAFCQRVVYKNCIFTDQLDYTLTQNTSPNVLSYYYNNVILGAGTASLFRVGSSIWAYNLIAYSETATTYSPPTDTTLYNSSFHENLVSVVEQGLTGTPVLTNCHFYSSLDSPFYLLSPLVNLDDLPVDDLILSDPESINLLDGNQDNIGGNPNFPGLAQGFIEAVVYEPQAAPDSTEVRRGITRINIPGIFNEEGSLEGRILAVPGGETVANYYVEDNSGEDIFVLGDMTEKIEVGQGAYVWDFRPGIDSPLSGSGTDWFLVVPEDFEQYIDIDLDIDCVERPGAADFDIGPVSIYEDGSERPEGGCEGEGEDEDAEGEGEGEATEGEL